MGSIKGTLLANLMIINFNDLLIFRADVFQSGIKLIQRELGGFKKFG